MLSLFKLNAISAVDALIGTATKGPLTRIYFYKCSAFPGYRVELILRRYGIRAWGRELHGDRLSFLVSRKQRDWALYVLVGAGVPVCAKDAPAQAKQATPWYEDGEGAKSAVGHLGDLMAGIFGFK